MKPAVSALNDWIQRIAANPDFRKCVIQRDNTHCTTIKLGSVHHFDFNTENYIYDYAIIIELCMFQNELGGKLQHAVMVKILTPSCFLKDHTTDARDIQMYSNITLKNLFEFNKLFKSVFCVPGEISSIYGIPNYNKLYFAGNTPKTNFESYVKAHENEFYRFNNFKVSLFEYLRKCSYINAKKKDINKDFVKGE